MKYIRKFSEGYNYELSIEDHCIELGIGNFEITEDNIVNVNGECEIHNKKLDIIPVQFGVIYGDFNCARNNLISLKGSPIKSESFYCSYNKLTSLEYSPKEVNDTFSCSQNNLINLKYSPKIVKYFYCSKNNLLLLKNGPEIIYENFGCNGNKLKTLKYGPKEVAKSYDCSNNELFSLEGAPEIFRGSFFCGMNPIHNIFKLFRTYGRYKDSLDYNYLRGKNIIKHRFGEALEEVDKELPEFIPGYEYI